MNNSYDDDEDGEDILGPIGDEFSIRTDIQIKKKATTNNKLKKS